MTYCMKKSIHKELHCLYYYLAWELNVEEQIDFTPYFLCVSMDELLRLMEITVFRNFATIKIYI